MASGKKNARRLGAHIVFIDESGFLLMPSVVRTWAPRGQTPILRSRWRREKISAISGLSVSPVRHRLGLYYHLHYKTVQQEEVCAFLRDLLRHLRGHVLVVWDAGPSHQGRLVQDFQARRRRLHVETFPTYAPELNPDEGVWKLAKGALANSGPDDLSELTRSLFRAMERIRRSPRRLKGCINHSDLPFYLP